MRMILWVSAALVSMPLMASAQFTGGAAPAAASLSAQDTKFITAASAAGLAEVQDGQLAQQKGDSAVQAVGAKMAADHAKANGELKALAISKGATLPNSVTPVQATESANLKQLSGAAFDTTYLANQKTAHEQAISLFKAEAASGTDKDLKAFASSTLPTLQMHLQMIETAQK